MAAHLEILQSYLRWEPRITAAEPSLARAFIGLPTKIEPSAPRSHAATPEAYEATQNKRLRENFSEYFLRRHPRWAQEDVKVGCKLLFEAAAGGLIGLYTTLIEATPLRIDFIDRRPRINFDAALQWPLMLDHVDEESIVAFSFVKAGNSADAIGALDDWKLTATIGDDELDRLLEQGIADLHVHIGGIRSASLLWHAVGLGITPLSRIRRYRPASITEIEDDSRRDSLERECARIVCATSGSDPHLANLYALRATRPNARAHAPRDAQDAAALLERERSEERLMLARAFAELAHAAEGEQTPASARLEASLDHYLHAKASFLRALRQPSETNPGLGVFRNYFRGVRQLWGDGRPPPARFGYSPRLQSTAFAEYGMHVAQSAHARQVELRLAPLGAPIQYHRFVQAWERMEDALQLGDYQIRFAIHFKRSADRLKARGEAAHITLAREIDREAAQLHSFLTDERFEKTSKRIARIDLAGQERDASPLVSAFALRLLRGEADAIDALDAEDIDPNVHRYWLLLKKRGHHIADPKRLGLTCHAGEDFAHPLEGLFGMHMALTRLGMRAGDTIGHGLAAGVDIKDWNLHHTPRRYQPVGLIFDALLWLEGLVETGRLKMGAAARQQLSGFLNARFKDFFGGERPADAPRILALRAGPTPSRTAEPSDPIAKLHARECWDKKTIKAREAAEFLPAFFADITQTLQQAQKLVLDDLKGAGVALELNPSSNLRVSGSRGVAQAPFMNLIERARVDASLNTDDPGTFGTRIENEYAIVAAALQKRGMRRSAINKKLEEIRETALRDLYWPT